MELSQSWIIKIHNNFQNQLENVTTRDRRFYNLDVFMDFARLTQKFSYNCEDCTKYKELLEDLSLNLSSYLDDIEGRRFVTNSFDGIVKHLRKDHKMYIYRYLYSLFTALGLFIGILVAVVLSFFFKHFLLNALLIVIGFTLLGAIVGWFVEEKKKAKNQIYGRFY